MNMFIRRFWKIVVAFCMLMLSHVAYSFDPFVIEDIRVEGLQRISAGAVFVVLPVVVGDEIDDSLSTRSIQALFDTGFFSDIRLDRDGNTLVIVVVENPSIAEVTITGNKKIKTEQIELVLEANNISNREVYNPIRVNEFIEGLKQEYKSAGRFSSEVKATLVPLERNRVELFIDIFEGPIALIDEIRIVGNEAFTTKDILDEMELSTKKTLGFLNRNNRYSRPKLTADLEQITSHYQDNGYIQFEIISSQAFLSEDKESVYIVITLSEGPQFTFGEINIIGEQNVVPVEEIEEIVLQEEGTVFSREEVNSDRQEVVYKFANEGYSLSSVEAYPDIREEEQKVNVEYIIDPGKLTYVRRIVFIGNIVTSDEVMRREMRIFEGGKYSAQQIAESRGRLGRLGFFESIDLRTQTVPGVEDQVDIVVEVKERLTGSFAFGVGYSDSDQLILQAELSQANLYGTGKRVAGRIRNNSVTTELQFDFINPYYTPEGVARGFNFTLTDTDTSDSDISSYRLDLISGGISYRFPIAQAQSIGIQLGLDHITFGQVDNRSVDYRTNNFINDNPKSILGRGSLSFVKDDRDRAIFPTSGGDRRVSYELVGGDFSYYVGRVGITEYFSIGGDTTLRLSTSADFGDGIGSTDGLPFYRRFYAGGQSTVRGFASASLGPREQCKFEFIKRIADH